VVLAIAGRRTGRIHRQGNADVRIGAYSPVALVCLEGFGAIRSAARHRDGATKASRGILRPSLRDHRSLHMTLQEPLAPNETASLSRRSPVGMHQLQEASDGASFAGLSAGILWMPFGT